MSKSNSRIFHQTGVIPIVDDGIFLITTRGSQRWIVPKGCLESGLTPREVAELEAWEEAGLIGKLSRDPVGSFDIIKQGLTYQIRLYVMHVSKICKKWPEKHQRKRVWKPLNKALERIPYKGLRQVIRKKVK